MSDAKPNPEADQSSLWFDTTNSNTPDYYVNIGFATVSNNDVCINLGRQLLGVDGLTSKSHSVVRITMTHNMFILMMTDLLPHYHMLKDLYGDELPNLVDLERRHPERFEAIRQRVSGEQ